MASRWSIGIRVLHAALVVTVTLQLILSQMMAPPGEGDGWLLLAFRLHAFFGMTTLLLALIHWWWSWTGRDGGLETLFPWSSQGRMVVWADVQELLHGKLPQGGPQSGLPSFVHGLGLLLVTLQALGGMILFLALPASGPFPEGINPLRILHRWMGRLVMLFWIGHGGMALVHHLKGDKVLKEMLPWNSR